MTLPSGLLSPIWVALAWAGALVFLSGAIWSLVPQGFPVVTKNWGRCRFLKPELLNPWLGGIVSLTLLWQLEIKTEQGLVLHLLGSGLFALMFGPIRGLLGLLVVLLAVTANGHGEWSMLGPNLFANAVLPIAIISLWQFGVRRYLPAHLFVFVFANGFFGAALTLFLTGVVVMLMVLAGSAAPLDTARFIDGWLPPVFLLSFSEAWLSGMILTLLVIYRPEWVASFDGRQRF